MITLPEQFKQSARRRPRRGSPSCRSRPTSCSSRRTAAYGELAGRGKRAVDEAVGSAEDLSGKAEKRAEGVLADVVERVDPAFEKVQEGVTVARKTVTGRTATETVTPRAAAKATASRAAKKAPAKKAAATTAPARRLRQEGSGQEGSRQEGRRQTAEPPDRPRCRRRDRRTGSTRRSGPWFAVTRRQTWPVDGLSADAGSGRSAKGVSRRSWPGSGSGTARFRTG